MKKDITDREDIELLVNKFYEKVRTDELIGPFFTDIIKINWADHLPRMYDFWENVLFYTGKYEGNPMAKHHNLHKKSPMEPEHFERWQSLFSETVQENFEGVLAELIIKKAISIGTVIQAKISS